MFPYISLSYLKELVELTGGDMEYAAAMALEAKFEMQSRIVKQEEEEEEENGDEQNDKQVEEYEKEEVVEGQPSSSNFDDNKVLAGFCEKKTQLSRESSSSNISHPPSICLSRHFLKSTYDQFAVELGLPKLHFGEFRKYTCLLIYKYI